MTVTPQVAGSSADIGAFEAHRIFSNGFESDHIFTNGFDAR